MTSDAIMSEGAAGRSQELDREAELVRRAQAHSQEAWTEIYEKHQAKLFRYVMARVGDQELAEDLTAAVFLEALKSIDGYTSRGRPFLAWLYRIARNVVNYHHRSTFRKKEQGLLAVPSSLLSQFLGGRGRGEDAAERLTIAGDDAGHGDPASVVERWDLRQAIDLLSSDQRDVIILRYFVGLTTPEVAAVLGKHERAVYSLQTRAIKALRRHLG